MKIINNQLDVFTKKFDEKYQINVEISEDVKKQIAKEGINPKFGARNLNAYITSNVVSKISQAYVKKEIKKGDKIILKKSSEKDGKLAIIKKVENKFPRENITRNR